MIFVTVGTQLPFERLIMSMDKWAVMHPGVDIFAQIGQTQYQPKNFEFVTSLPPKEYDYLLDESQVIVGHVGMGTIITGIQKNKPLVLMPRHASKGEHRNDHQLSTAERFKNFKSIDIVDSEDDLSIALETRLFSGNIGSEATGPSPSLIKILNDFVEAGF